MNNIFEKMTLIQINTVRTILAMNRTSLNMRSTTMATVNKVVVVAVAIVKVDTPSFKAQGRHIASSSQSLVKISSLLFKHEGLFK